ncbi:mitochondrial inner-membrane-bound regulator-domain-containing protein [Lipomyces chichibuensis]|uniref:mitochondrial inner-membrane-bound regulator-domain-containing protein n=1 Tax=Lipomyces chichibuensis TaxID=1546026 RepID=UPI003342F786
MILRRRAPPLRMLVRSFRCSGTNVNELLGSASRRLSSLHSLERFTSVKTAKTTSETKWLGNPSGVRWINSTIGPQVEESWLAQSDQEQLQRTREGQHWEQHRLTELNTAEQRNSSLPSNSDSREKEEFFNVNEDVQMSDSTDDIIIIDQGKFIKKRTLVTPTVQLIEPEIIDSSAMQLLVQEAPGSETLVESINELQPKAKDMSEERYVQTKQILNGAFNREQLVKYARLHGGRTSSKAAAIKFIMNNVWQLQISGTVRRDLLTERVHYFTERRELVLLLSRDAKLPREWSKLGAEVVINPSNLTLVVRATEEIAHIIISKLEHVLKNIIDVRIDLSCLSHAPSATIDDIRLGMISRLTSSAVDVIDRTTLRISSLTMSRIDVARRLVILSLNLYGHERQTLLYHAGSLVLGDTTFYRVHEDESLPWQFRSSQWTRWRSVKRRPYIDNSATVSEFMLEYPMIISRENAKMMYDAYKLIDPKEDRSYAQQLIGFDPTKNADKVVSDTVRSLIRGIAEEEEGRSRQADADNAVVESEQKELSDDELYFSGVFSKLNELTKDDVLPNRDGYLLDRPEYTATFGYALHEESKIGHAADAIRKSKLHGGEKYTFLENSPIFTRFIDKFATANTLIQEQSGSVRESVDGGPLDLLELMPHSGRSTINTYVLLRFVPSPYAHPSDFTDYPPIEMTIPTTHKWIIENNRASVLAHESDAVTDLCLQEQELDVRFRRRVAGHVSTDQAGIKNFLDKLDIDLLDRKVVKIPPTVDIVVHSDRSWTQSETLSEDVMMNESKPPDGMIRYLFKSFEQRTELKYRHKSYTLKYCIVEGGVLDGRRIETRLEFDPEMQIEHTETELQRFATTAVDLAVGATMLSRR